jgi:type VI secretion system protein ImpM
MSGPVVGFFGKLPSHGDFIERRVDAGFHEVWDAWLQKSLTESRTALGARWLDCYLTSPLWRFFLCEGVAGTASYAGVLLPSVDRVGRYFPLTVVAELPAGLAPVRFARAAASWFSDVEALCTDALQNADSELDEFDGALAASGARLAGLDQPASGVVFPGSAQQWHWPVRRVDELANALVDPLITSAQAALRPLTLWWTTGSELVQPCVLLLKALPRPDSYAALLAGGWDDGHWEGVAAAQVDALGAEPPSERESPERPPAAFAVTSAGTTDPGMVRKVNEDALLADEGNRLWAVADGMGGHSHGGEASQMVIDALRALSPTASLNAACQSVSEALARVNADLRRGALGVGGGTVSGSTVVTLLIRGVEIGVQWAGDSRAYRLRDGTLKLLTRDHSTAFNPEETAVRAPGSGEITRAVGGDDELELDQLSDVLADGDRFLLCSDGLYDALDAATMANLLAGRSAREASEGLVEAARTAGASDNVTAVVVEARTEGPAS